MDHIIKVKKTQLSPNTHFKAKMKYANYLSA